MNSTELLEAFRDEMVDTEAPYLWSDAAIYRYLDDAQKMFCRLTEGVEDSRTTALTQLAVTPGTEWLTLSPLILKVRTALRADNGREVSIIPIEKAQDLGIRFNGQAGPVKHLVAGMEKRALRLWPVPNETVTLNLSVFRLPLQKITDAGDQELEIDEQHHEALLFWMKHKAYDKQDAETFDRRKSDEFEARFRVYCTAALKEQERARRDNGTVIYGGL